MGEGLFREEGGDRYEVFSAGTNPTQVRPEAIAVMREIGIDISGHRSKSVDEFGENNGEVPAELQQALFDYCEAFGQKVDNIARYIRSQEFEAANASAEIARLNQRKAAAENRSERLKGLLKFFMHSRNVRSMKGRLNTISLRKNSQDSLILSDATKLPAEFWRVSVVLRGAELQEVLSYLPREHALRARLANADAVKREPDHARLRAFLVGGNMIDGVELRREHHIRLT
jgi:hypothetical protein